MLKILFVDDDPNILQGFQRMLRPMRHEWEMDFASSGQEALQILAKSPFDAVVSDMRMPGMSGSQLLGAIMKEHPHIVRIILSGHSEINCILQSVNSAHQYLSKPCDFLTLKDSITRTHALRKLLANESLKCLISQIKSIPSIPSLYLELMEELKSENSSIQNIGKIISRDIGMSAKILQLVNSSFFGTRRHMANLMEAVVFLGIETIRALVLSSHIFSQLNQSPFCGYSIEDLWDHSLRACIRSSRFAQACNMDQKLVDYSMMAGLLHDAGKLILIANLQEEYRKVLNLKKERGLPEHEAEKVVFLTSHAEVGAYLLGLWGLPDPVVEAVAYHHSPSNCSCPSISPLTAVYLANILDEKHEIGNLEKAKFFLDLDYLSKIKVDDKLADFWNISQQACT